MKEQMIEDGYTEKNGQWTSPYTGETSSFQPMREEYITICKLGRLLHNSPRNWFNQLRQSDNRNKGLVKQLREKSRRENQLFEVFTAAQALLEYCETGSIVPNNVLDKLKTAIADVAANVTPPQPEERNEIFVRATMLEPLFPWDDV
jgi:hypothetical protein